MSHTMREVAERAGVSPATVSRVLNKTQYISPDTEQRVRGIAAGGLGQEKYSKIQCECRAERDASATKTRSIPLRDECERHRCGW